MSENRFSLPFSAVILAVGLVASSFLVGKAIVEFKKLDRVVSVKGLAEQEFAADQAIWPMRFTVTANALPQLQQQVNEATETVRVFLKKQGFSEEEMNSTAANIVDHYAYGSNPNNRPPRRYSAQAVLTVRTKKITAVKRAMSAAGDLVTKGVMLAHGYGSQASFQFTRLNEIKPDMIAQATKNARSAARQFAQDSGSQVGAIMKARQGLFSITNRDQFTPEFKIVRVVTTVDFQLEN